jgi:hypothetical protein
MTPTGWTIEYFVDDDGSLPVREFLIVLLHGFQKKTQKAPRKEIALALKRLNRFLQRTEGGEQS